MKPSYLLTAFLFFATFNYTQTIQIGFGGGSTIVTGSEFYTNELKGYFLLDMLKQVEQYSLDLQGLDFLSEYNVCIKAKMLFPDFPISIYGELSYNFLKGKGEVRIINPVSSSSFPLPRDAESKCNLFNTSLGAEIRVLNQTMTPYIDLGFVISYLGDINIKTADDYKDYEEMFLEGALRYGFEAGIGWDYKFSSNCIVGISTKFTGNNLFGKLADEKSLNTLRTNIYFLYEL